MEEVIKHYEELIIKYDKEVMRLKYIINELEKYLIEQIDRSWEIEEQCYETILEELQELKGSDK